MFGPGPTGPYGSYAYADWFNMMRVMPVYTMNFAISPVLFVFVFL